MEQTLRNLIAEGNTKKALSILRGLQTLDKAWRNKIILLNTRYANYENDSMNVNANRGTLQAELMTLNAALLDLIDDLETEGSLEAAASEQESQLARAEKNIIDNINKQTDTQNQFLLTQIAALIAQQAEGDSGHATYLQELKRERTQLLNERENALTQAHNTEWQRQDENEIAEGKQAYYVKDYTKSFLLLFKHKDNKAFNAEAKRCLGFMYHNGYGVVEDDIAAVTWYLKAAEQGDAAGQNNLGEMYRNGDGIMQDYFQAVKWFQRAAEQGRVSGQRNLGEMYHNGFGVKQDYH